MASRLALFHLPTLGCLLTQPKRNIQCEESADGAQLPFVVSLGCLLCLCFPTAAFTLAQEKTDSPDHSPSSKIRDVWCVRLMIHSFFYFSPLTELAMKNFSALTLSFWSKFRLHRADNWQHGRSPINLRRARFLTLIDKGRTTARRERICHLQQDEALFSSVANPRWRWNNWNNCGNAALRKRENHWRRRRRRAIEKPR